MNNIKLAVFDLDRTLLRTDKSLSDYTLNVFQRCGRAGVALAFATARSERSCASVLARFAPNIFISNGGALAKISGREVYSVKLDQQTADALIGACIASPAVDCITVEADDGYFVNYSIDPNRPGWVDYSHAVYFDFARERFGREIYKLTAELSNIRAADEISDLFESVSLTAFSGENWCRFAHMDATKWRSIAAVARHMSIDAKEIAAFGDDFLDIEMVQNCGVGVAVANAIDEVKAAARHICPSNDEDGVARWLEQNIL